MARSEARQKNKANTSETSKQSSSKSAGEASLAPDRSQKEELPPEREEGIRLNVYLQRHGVASRRKADELIAEGEVRINRKVVTTLGVKVLPEDKVSVKGRVLKAKPPQQTYLFNKPDLYLTTRKDSRSRSTIFDIPTLKKLPNNVQPVGRLDFRSEGLLVLTNDGDLAYALSHPRFHVEKTYAVLVSEVFSTDDLERLRNGVDLSDGFAKPLSVKLGGSERLGATRGQWLKIVVVEGRNRLLRRMLAAIGFKVVRLIRIGIGSIQLPDQLHTGQLLPASEVVMEQLEKYRERMKTELSTSFESKSPVRRKSAEEKRAPRKKNPGRRSSPARNTTPAYRSKGAAESLEVKHQKKRRTKGNTPKRSDSP